MNDDRSESRRRISLGIKDDRYGLSVRERGAIDAPPVLFLHGFPTSSLDWTRVLPLLGEVRAIAPDLLGFGRSDKPRIRYGFPLQADLITALLAELGIEHARFIAHDYADTLVQELLAREAEGALPFRIDRIVYLNGGVYARLHRQRPIQRILRTPVLGPLIARRMTSASLRKSLNALAGNHDAWSAADADAHWREIAHADGLARLPRLLHYIGDRRRHAARWESAMEAAARRSAFVWGPADPVSGAAMLAEVRRRMPDAEFHELDGLGHYPHWEDPQRAAAAIRQALG
jgi:pimeloyl-ACP methyl ester carboxylesterase